MAEKFSVSLLMRRKGNKFTVEGFTKFLESHGFENIRVGESNDGYVRFQAIQPIVINNKNEKQPKTIFIKCNDEMIIQDIKLSNGYMSSVEEMNKTVGQGCLIIIGIIVVVAIIISSCTNMMDFDTDGDCNDSYIEQDYNGDGEEDAEDFRIQTEGC